MRILVTGGAGFIGSHLAEALLSEGHRVHIVDNFDAYYAPSLKRRNARAMAQRGAAIHQLDLAIDPLEGILEGLDFVIHAAAQPGNDPSTSYGSYLKNNFQATVALAEALRGRGIPLIHISTSSVYGINATGDENTLPAPVSPYGVTKLGAEAAVLSAVRRGEIQATVLRCFSVYGPRERPDKLFPRLFSALKHQTPLPIFEGSHNHQRSFSYVSDIVSGVLLTMKNWDQARGEVFNIGTDQTFTTGQALDLAQQIAGKNLIVKKLPARPGDQLATRANIEKARRVLGFVPRTSLKDGLTQTWQWAQKEL